MVELGRRAGIITLVAIAYAVAGRLGLVTAIPPGYATLVWLPSAIALGAVLWWGSWVFPGIIIGSALVNVEVQADFWWVFTNIKALAIGAGAAMQAIAGGFLAARYAGWPNWPDNVKMAIFCGPVACLINASWSTSLLVGTGAMSVVEWPVSWLAWYMGDTAWVVLCLPWIVDLKARKTG